MSFDRAFGRTIQLYLVDGTPSGLRKATIHGWTGIVLIGGETSFASLTSRAEMGRPGIYFLTGPNPESDGTLLMYIGSANSVRERIQQSAEKRAFWETAVAVVTSDDGLSKGHVEYLEARLIEMVILRGGSRSTTRPAHQSNAAACPRRTRRTWNTSSPIYR